MDTTDRTRSIDRANRNIANKSTFNVPNASNGKLPGYLCYMVFDCLYVNGHSLLSRPLEGRQAILGGIK